jgi:hypothetical protein
MQPEVSLQYSQEPAAGPCSTRKPAESNPHLQRVRIRKIQLTIIPNYVLLQCSQKPASGSYSEPAASNPHIEPAKICKIQLTIMPQAYEIPVLISWLSEPLLATEERLL